jgi:hypothetical protein
VQCREATGGVDGAGREVATTAQLGEQMRFLCAEREGEVPGVKAKVSRGEFIFFSVRRAQRAGKERVDDRRLIEANLRNVFVKVTTAL